MHTCGVEALLLSTCALGSITSRCLETSPRSYLKRGPERAVEMEPWCAFKARFKRRATAVPNSIDRIKFDFSTAVARRLKPSRATAVPNSIHKLQMHYNTFKSLLNLFFIIVFCFWQQPFYSTELNSTSETKSC